MNNRFPLLAAIPFIAAISFPLVGQIRVPLSIDKTPKASSGQSLLCDKQYKCGLWPNEESKISDPDPQSVKVQVWRDGKDFLIAVDTNANGRLDDEKKIPLKNNSAVSVSIRKRQRSGQQLYLPFEISHERVQIKDQAVDEFYISAHYLAMGILKYRNCSSKIALSDMDQNGAFDSADAKGTNLEIDVNNDGKFWGATEFYKSVAIIEFCGQNFIVSGLNNSRIVFTRTNQKSVNVGAPVPSFSFALVNGARVTRESLMRGPYLIGFWASWCVPCVQELDRFNELRKQYADRVRVFSINVDDRSRRRLARSIVRDKGISEFTSIRGMGDADILWKSFGKPTRLTIPLYVLVDGEGIVRYAGAGGANLSDVKDFLEKKFPTGAIRTFNTGETAH
jgi:thiol-disulfide isomerase/thioredoxin